MWRLDEFRFDEEIEADEVYVFDDSIGELVPIGRDEAIALAHGRELNLVAWWPVGAEAEMPSCIMSKVSLPLRWEKVTTEPADEPIDERLWFEAPCGGRDLLLEGGGHTFRGRMSAWCPDKDVSYRVSLSEMGEMSEEARYFIRGYLSGNEPNWPEDDGGYTDPDDLVAWQEATRRFRQTGSWYGRWGTCSVCGCVLLPDSASDRCAEHHESTQSSDVKKAP
jgi:hypothetical protein